MFQSTHPGRGATIESISCRLIFIVSIHAPRAGCDILARTILRYRLTFQSTHPGRGATKKHYYKIKHDRFQSTHPGRGATDSLSDVIGNSAGVSIHAPRAGCDDRGFIGWQPRYSVSIHAPRAGCDFTK